MPEMSLSEAARWAGVTRATIHKALKNGRLSGHKDESGEWRIDPSELERAYQPGKTVDVAVDSQMSSSGIPQLMAGKERELVLLREILAELRAQRDDAIEQRNRAMALAEAQTRLLAHQQQGASAAAPETSPPAPVAGGWRARLGWLIVGL